MTMMAFALEEPKHMLPADMQMANEFTYSRKHIDKYILSSMMADPVMVERVSDGVQRLQSWMDQETYGSGSAEHVRKKKARIEQLRGLELDTLIWQLFTGIAYVRRPELFVSVTSQLA